ncbi:MAG TPA: alpha/beta fold hydrolase [Propionibacteriaceae bacterium]|nr:alpha/beta fold hydrolase [Propionibacteriaceae bacterium]
MPLSQLERKTRYAKAGSVNIAYQVVGDGPVDLVLSFGWVTHLDLAWSVGPLARFLDELASFSRLIVFDKRGTGLSDRVHPDTLPRLEQRMEDVVAVMDAAGSERAALLGTLGAAMCGLFAATHPERAAALILYGAFGKLEPATGLLARLADTQELALDRVEREWGTEGVGLAFWAPSLLDDEETKAAYLRLTRSGASPGSARSLMTLGYQIDWEAVLPGIRAPTLVLHRTGDLVVPLRQARKLARDIPGARFVELPGIDHLIWAGDQDAVVEEARSFLAEAGLGGGHKAAREPAPADGLGLTRREHEVLRLVARGLTNRQIAAALFISAKTAGMHVSNILSKMGVERRAEAAAVAERLHLLASPAGDPGPTTARSPRG